MVESREQEQSIARAYHYARKDKVWEIERGGTQKIYDEKSGSYIKNPPGLAPITEIGDTDAVFCFNGSPCPPEWQKNPRYFEGLLQEIGLDNLLLYSFDVFPSDKPYMVDFARRQSSKNLDALQLNILYAESMVPLEHYRGGFFLPELAITGHIDFSRLTPMPLPEIVEHLRSQPIV